ncbi:MAG TPA: radical SAM protein [bacterium]|jgi:threonylcarbamoyladenosine tRNA methylthiotransferase MtaB
MPGIFVRTFGCKQNQFDSELLRRRFLDSGSVLAASLELAESIVLNTCAVTQKAISKARGEIGRLRRMNPRARISAVGCGVRYHREAFDGADDFAELSLPGSESIRCEPERELRGPHGVIPVGKTRGFLRIQSGCDEECAYCIVPRLRGPSRSVSITDCLTAQQELLSQGALEIVLTGTNIALWGRDLPGRPALLDLLKSLVAQIGPARLRLSSLEAPLLAPEFLDWCLQEPKICRHFHIALQSASPRVLEKMNRDALSESAAVYLKTIANDYPDVCIGADIIAGLPCETESDFSQTLDWIRNVPLSYLHVFPYSEREGTKAAGMGSFVALLERRRRAAAFRQLGVQLKNEFIFRNQNHLGGVVELGRNRAGRLQGLASNYLHVTCNGDYRAADADFPMPLTGKRAVSIHLQPSS